MTLLDDFCTPGKASFIIGGQWGSEAKGAAAAWVAKTLAEQGKFFDVYTTNASAQAGHTSVHKGKKRIAYHLPTAALIAADYGEQNPFIYLNEGCAIDPEILRKELLGANLTVSIHPRAAIITEECKRAEGFAGGNMQAISSTQKGVGAAYIRKISRTPDAIVANSDLRVLVMSYNLNNRNESVLVEVPQGIGLSIGSQFYPFTTSRNCTVHQAAADAQIHPHFFGKTMLVLRTYPIRVGNLPGGHSGSCYHDQKEISWEGLGVEPEITTVTKRVRRVFTWSRSQTFDAICSARPDYIMLTFCNYPMSEDYKSRIVQDLHDACIYHGVGPTKILYEHGPTTDDVRETW